jgi:hypothetical protein
MMISDDYFSSNTQLEGIFVGVVVVVVVPVHHYHLKHNYICYSKKLN